MKWSWICLALIAAPLFAADNDDAVRELGSAVGWRLGPLAVEEHCRAIDPEGDAQRHASVQTWAMKNERLIKAVDERVLEILPILQPRANVDDVLHAFSDQVKQVMLEATFEDKSVEQAKAICKADAHLTGPHYTNGLPQVQEALAALYDWKIVREQQSKQ